MGTCGAGKVIEHNVGTERVRRMRRNKSKTTVLERPGCNACDCRWMGVLHRERILDIRFARKGHHSQARTSGNSAGSRREKLRSKMNRGRHPNRQLDRSHPLHMRHRLGGLPRGTEIDAIIAIVRQKGGRRNRLDRPFRQIENGKPAMAEPAPPIPAPPGARPRAARLRSHASGRSASRDAGARPARPAAPCTNGRRIPCPRVGRARRAAPIECRQCGRDAELPG